MKVIVAGLPKTGTKSMTTALKELGYEVYDFVEHMYYLETEWYDVFEKGWTTEKLHRMYKDVDAAVDMPASYFWEEMSKAFPDAKIILTVRDSEEDWVKSLKHHYETLDSHILARILQLVEVLLGRKAGLLLTISYKVTLNIDRTLFGRRTHLNESLLKLKYRVHNAYVKQNAPSDKLLVFNCKQGWDPLCKFLEAPTPSTPFPHKNVKAAVVKETVNAHPVAEKYKAEIVSSLVMLVAKLIFSCVAFVFLASAFA